MTETFTKQQIDGWLAEIGREHEGRKYALAYRIGFGQGLVAVQAKMDDEIKRRRPESFWSQPEAQDVLVQNWNRHAKRGEDL